MNYPIELNKLAESIYQKTKKFACYDETTGWQCPVFDYELECDADCKKHILAVCKEMWRNGIIKFKNGKLQKGV